MNSCPLSGSRQLMVSAAGKPGAVSAPTCQTRIMSTQFNFQLSGKFNIEKKTVNFCSSKPSSESTAIDSFGVFEASSLSAGNSEHCRRPCVGQHSCGAPLGHHAVNPIGCVSAPVASTFGLPLVE